MWNSFHGWNLSTSTPLRGVWKVEFHWFSPDGKAVETVWKTYRAT